MSLGITCHMFPERYGIQTWEFYPIILKIMFDF